MITFKHLHLKNVIEDFQTYNSIEILKEKAALSKLHTKQLLQLRNRCYRVHGDKLSNYWEYFVDGIRFSLIKQELDGREHIPNKQESKQIRKQKHVRYK